MSILRFPGIPSRQTIGFIGKVPGEAKQVLADRGFSCIQINSHVLKNKDIFWGMDSIVLIQDEKKPKRISTELKKYCQHLLPRDCRIYVVPVNPSSPDSHLAQKYIHTAIDDHEIPYSGINDTARETFGDWDLGPSEYIFSPFAHVFSTPYTWNDFATIIQKYSQQDGYADPLDIMPSAKNEKSLKLSDEEKCLLRRAFYDCNSIELEEVGGGLSGVYTYKVYARIKVDNVSSSWPFIYFVKLGNRRNIATEYKKYLSHALNHIPYHLGPGLHKHRCALGYKRGVIVSDYVHNAETLLDCAKGNRAGPAINHLFSHTLKNWHNGASVTQSDFDFPRFLLNKIEKPVPAHRWPTIQSFGATRDLSQMKQMIEKVNSQPALVGPIHADLHATNVLVRSNDAIIIDIEKLEENGPLLYDVASVEAGLFVDGFIGDTRKKVSEILDSILPMYELKAFEQDCNDYNINDPSTWFFESVRQLRMYAREMQVGNQCVYPWVLATALLKKSCNQENFDVKPHKKVKTGLSRESVRAITYVLSERILTNLK